MTLLIVSQYSSHRHASLNLPPLSSTFAGKYNYIRNLNGKNAGVHGKSGVRDQLDIYGIW